MGPALQPPVKSTSKSAAGQRLRSLDGIRAISVGLVILGHLSGTRGFAGLNLGIGDYAHLGVVVFFVISGFLITSLLVAEHASHGGISLKLFYARRALRIFPPSYVYLIAAVTLSAFGLFHLTTADIATAATYTANYLPERSWLTGHLWSLSVEEQFYLLWPFTFAAMGPRRSPLAAAGVVLLGPIARLADRLLLVGTPYYHLPMFPMVADSLAMGCLLATSREWLEKQEWYLRLFRPQWSIAMLAFILLLNREAAPYTAVWILGSSVSNACIAILVHRAVYDGDSWTTRFLNWRPLAFVGGPLVFAVSVAADFSKPSVGRVDQCVSAKSHIRSRGGIEFVLPVGEAAPEITPSVAALGYRLEFRQGAGAVRGFPAPQETGTPRRKRSRAAARRSRGGHPRSRYR
jgi:peptidoglycan/LPS O-acetylase OafA/YrhL